MEKLQFDSGIKEYRINGAGVLRFNPGDPNLYARFLEAGDKLLQVEKDMTAWASKLPENAGGSEMLQLMAEADKQMKQVLNWVFGAGNDFDKILGGVNLLAVANNGQRVVTNLLNALQPILLEGAERCAREKVDDAVKKARQRREAL